MTIKRLCAVCLALCTLLLCACGTAEIGGGDETGPITLNVWAYPTGGTPEDLQALLQKFTDGHPQVTFELTMLGENDQSVVSASIESGTGPDLLLGDLRQLRHAFHAGGQCIDLTDLLHKDVYPTVTDGCVLDDGTLFALPLAMDVTVMAINYEMFRAADALQYIDEETHTWTTENFFLALDAIGSSDVAPHGLCIYCGGQNGDDGTRALVSNLYGGRFMTLAQDRYTPDDPLMQQALTELLAHGEVFFDGNVVGSDESLLFYREQVAMTLCWSSALPQPEHFTAFPMAYPTAEEQSLLPVNIWGASVYDTGSPARIEAAQQLLTFLTGTAQNTRTLARTLGHFPVRYMSGFDGEEEVYNHLMVMADAYEQDAPGYAIARTEWYEMLRRIAAGGEIAAETRLCARNANKAANDL